MLLPNNVSPQNCVYYNAAFVLEVLLKKKTLTLHELYHEVRKKHNMTFSLFILCLDWLYMIGSISTNDKSILLCI